jgi:hypothetical protein
VGLRTEVLPSDSSLTKGYLIRLSNACLNALFCIRSTSSLGGLINGTLEKSGETISGADVAFGSVRCLLHIDTHSEIRNRICVSLGKTMGSSGVGGPALFSRLLKVNFGTHWVVLFQKFVYLEDRTLLGNQFDQVSRLAANSGLVVAQI